MTKIIISALLIANLCGCSCFQQSEQTENPEFWPEKSKEKHSGFSLKVLCVPF